MPEAKYFLSQFCALYYRRKPLHTPIQDDFLESSIFSFDGKLADGIPRTAYRKDDINQEISP